MLLKRQRRANIHPPLWLHPDPLSLILDVETQHEEYKNAFSPPPRLPGQPSLRGRERMQPALATPQYSLDGQRYFPSPPFLPQNDASQQHATTSSSDPPSLPYHWLEVGNTLLNEASDDLVDPDQIRRLLKELTEVRMAKLRAGVDVLDAASTGGSGVALTGVGAMELGESRGFVEGVVDELRFVYVLALSFRLICVEEDPKKKKKKKSSLIQNLVSNFKIGKLALPRSRLGESKWPRKWQIRVTMARRMMRTWISELWLPRFLLIAVIDNMHSPTHFPLGRMPLQLV